MSERVAILAAIETYKFGDNQYTGSQNFATQDTAAKRAGLAEGGRGKKGGLSAYAGKVGKAKQTVSELVNAARVAEKCPVDRTVLHTKTQHLAAIHALPEAVWSAAVEAVVAKMS